MTGAPLLPLPSVDVLGVLRRLQSAGFCLDLDASAQGDAVMRPEEMAALFEQTLCLLFMERSQKYKTDVHPFPVMLGDGRPVDLLRLYGAVREKGGYRSVTDAGSWGSVAGEAGLDAALGSALKLIYAKYLRVLDRRLRKISGMAGEGTVGCEEEAGSFMGKVGEVGGGSSRGVLGQKGGSEEGTPSSSKEHSRTTLKGCGLKGQLDGGGGDDDVVISEPVNGTDPSPCIGRKREFESFVGVIDWLRAVAKCPGGPIGGMQLDGSKSTCLAVEEPFCQALLVREAMFADLLSNSGSYGSLSQKRQKVHPSMYDDYPEIDLINERLRYSQRIISLKKKSRLALCSGAAAVSEGESDKDLDESESEGINDKQCSRDHSLSYIAGISGKHRKCVIVGPEHQAKVPEWAGRDSAVSNDMDIKKFLGTQIWPLEREEQKPIIKQDPIGRGRQDTCGCDHHGSVECVRFHVAEKRFLLKRELGSAFYGMGFHRMGEEVSLSWTKEEEQKFKATVHQNPPSLSKSFWDPVFLCFPSKTRQSLVSYYFNVFILQRRSYQNRVTPKEIDSDDDESEFGFLSNAFGRNAVEVQNPKSIICVENSQCEFV